MEHALTFIKQKKEGDNLYSFHFEKPKKLVWTSGQHVTLRLNTDFPDEKNVRTLSVASSPHEDTIQFILKITEQKSRFKAALLALQPGDTLTLLLPRGIFVLKDEDTTKHVFIAGGVGIAPFRPILLDAAAGKHKEHTIELVYLAHEGNVAYKDECDSFAKQDTIRVHYATEREAAKTMTHELTKKYSTNAYYYVAGAPGMVDTFKMLLLESGISPEHIVLDIFTGYE